MFILFELSKELTIRNDEKIDYIPEVVIGIPSAFASETSSLLSCDFCISYLLESAKYKSNIVSKITVVFEIMFIISTPLFYCSYKLFQLSHKWHDNAVEIKQLIETNSLRF